MQASHSAIKYIIFSLVIFGVVYLVAMIGDFLLLRSMNAQAEAIGSEGRRIMNERYQTQDRALIAEAENEGFQYRILLPLLIEETADLSDLGREVGFAPLGLEANSKLFICNEGHGPLTITTDRFGFRNHDTVWDTQDGDLVLVGDSFAFGVCQQEQATIAGRLGEKYDVRNLSFPGATAVHYAAMLKTFGPRIGADKVVMIFYSNDNMSIEASQLYHDLFFSTQTDPSNFFDEREGATPAPAHNKFYKEARARVQAEKQAASQGEPGVLERSLKRAGKFLSHYSFPGVRTVVNSYRRALEDSADAIDLAVRTLKDHCADAECAPLILYIPNSPFWDPDPRSAGFAQSIAEISGEYEIPFLDLTNELAALGREKAYAEAGIHLSPEGYALVADAVTKYFNQNAASPD